MGGRAWLRSIAGQKFVLEIWIKAGTTPQFVVIWMSPDLVKLPDCRVLTTDRHPGLYTYISMT
jgi:hypothetical protein